MNETADAGRCVTHARFLVLRPRHEFTHARRWNDCRHDHDVRMLHELSDRREIARRIVARRIHQAVDDEARARHHHRMAVRNGLCRKLRADAAAASGAVLDDDGLAHPARKVLTDGAGRHVHAAARRDRNDESQRAVREGVGALRLRGVAGGAEEQRRCRDEPRELQCRLLTNLPYVTTTPEFRLGRNDALSRPSANVTSFEVTIVVIRCICSITALCCSSVSAALQSSSTKIS